MRNTIIPGFRYNDAQRAIAFLCDAFGFTRHAVYPDESDPSAVLHAELVWGEGMIMLGSARDTESTRAFGMKTLAEAGGPTSGLYLVVEDVDAHAARAAAAGAEIVLPPRDMSYGGRGYSAKDCEGYAWSFGSYDPWQAQ